MKILKRKIIMIVEIDNRQDDLDIAQDIIENCKLAVRQCLIYELGSVDYEVSISFVSEEEIKNLNKEYRNIDRITDVLSFPLNEAFDIKERMLGDIIISVKRAKEQAEDYGNSLKRELVYLTVHSMFHLFGYDHMTESDKKVMREKEKDVIRILGVYKGE